MKLYYAPHACSLAPHIVAREAGIPIELVEVDLAPHTLKNGADYFAIHPRGSLFRLFIASAKYNSRINGSQRWNRPSKRREATSEEDRNPVILKIL